MLGWISGDGERGEESAGGVGDEDKSQFVY